MTKTKTPRIPYRIRPRNGQFEIVRVSLCGLLYRQVADEIEAAEAISVHASENEAERAVREMMTTGTNRMGDLLAI
jgi:hypothetical protein